MSFSRDWDLKQRIVNFLRQKNVLRRDNVRVEVTGGLVTLSGHVNSYYEKQLFLSACQHVAGVVSILDDIDVIDTQAASAETTHYGHATVPAPAGMDTASLPR